MTEYHIDTRRLKSEGSINFLLLGGAKRVTMARMLKQAAAKYGLAATVTGYELGCKCALACEGNIVEGLRWCDPEILRDINRVVKERLIDIIIPFVDPAVGVAADFVASTETIPVFAPVAPREAADRMFDKIAAAQLFEENNISIPTTWRSGQDFSKLIAKPRHGSASKGIEIIDSQEGLERILIGGADKYLIQERIDHRQEITVDCYVDMTQGVPLCISPRLRLEVSGGEVVRTRTVADAEAIALTRRVLEATGLRGAVTVQLIRDLDTERLMVMEVNPRLGGGAVASVYAGGDIAGLTVGDFLGLPLEQTSVRPGVEVARYLSDVVFGL